MKKLGLILAVCLMAASCGSNNVETIDINEVEFDTLKVKVLIIGNDTVNGTINLNEVDY